MTLDEAITHHEWASQNSEDEVAEEHEQYAMWLWNLKQLRSVQDVALANARALVLENEQLKSENASLRGAAMGLGELCDQLKDENAKLRELIRAMWFLLCVTGNDDLVAEVAKNGETIRSVEATAIAEKMRELGIEVER